MSTIQYLVGNIPIPIALQIIRELETAHIPATLKTDAETAVIEVALADRKSLDDLLTPYEIQNDQPIIDISLPEALLHDAIMLSRFTLPSGSDADSTFTALLISYQTVANDSARLDQLADTCSRQIARSRLQLELLAGYRALSRLARWRADTLRGGR